MHRRCVDDAFLIFENESNMDSFFSYISNLHPNIKFTRETEQNNNTSFLDISITRQFVYTINPLLQVFTLDGIVSFPKHTKGDWSLVWLAMPGAFAHVLTALMQRLISSNQFLSKMATLLTLYKTV